MSLAISWECWNSAQSILMTARELPNRISAAASTSRVLPEPVGPRNKEIADGTAGRIQPGGEYLEEFDQGLDAFILTDDLRAQTLLELDGVRAAHIRIQ